MPPHCLAAGDGVRSDGEVSENEGDRGPHYKPDDDYYEEEDQHQWNSFEMRTLFCLIIKGEHQDRNGLLSGKDFASKLNIALNPHDPATTKLTAAQLYARDIPVRDVADMLHRVLDKKRHAIDVVSRSNARAVTRRQINAFKRQLDFRGDEEEWALTGRKEHVERQNEELRRRMVKEKYGGRMTPARAEENRDALEDIEDDSARKLLEDWRIGRSFYEGESCCFPFSPQDPLER